MLLFLLKDKKYEIAAVSASCECLADTWASDFGMIFGKVSFHPLKFKKMHVGTNGAISIEGTLIAFLGSVLGGLGFIFDFKAFLKVVAIGFAGCYFDSLLGIYL